MPIERDADTVERAYQVWVECAERAACVAERMGCAERTIRLWVADFGWKRRRLEDSIGDKANNYTLAKYLHSKALLNAIHRLNQIVEREGSSDRDAVNASRALVDLLNAFTRMEQTFDANQILEARFTPMMTDGQSDARNAATMALEQNVQQANVVYRMGRRNQPLR